LKDFSLNMIFLANYVQSDDFCFFSSRKRRKNLSFLSFPSTIVSVRTIGRPPLIANMPLYLGT